MHLKNLHIIDNKPTTRQNRFLKGDRLQRTGESKTVLEFDDALLFKSLINSHEHLAFNCFPPLHHKIYNNYKEWGEDIHTKDKETIKNILKIPIKHRVNWSIYKNIINGVTAIAQHGKNYKSTSSPIEIVYNRDFHSVGLEKWWKLKIKNPLNQKPICIHIGEGTDTATHEEINELINDNTLNRKLIGIHGIAMTEAQAKQFEALIWCPDSNIRLYNKTAPIDKLAKHTKILFGTDSTISSHWSIWHHIKLAKKLNLLSDEALYKSLTDTPRAVWNLPFIGEPKKGVYANFVIAKNKDKTNLWNAFYTLTPEDLLLVVDNGTVLLFDASLFDSILPEIYIEQFSKFEINGSPKYLLGNLTETVQIIQKYNRNIDFPIKVF